MPTSPTLTTTTTLIWGTSGVLSDSGFSAALIVSSSFQPIHNRTRVAGNTGFTAGLVDAEDGRSGTVECRYDTGITWPANMAVVGIKEKNETAAVLYHVVGTPATTRSQEGLMNISIALERFTDITLSQS